MTSLGYIGTSNNQFLYILFKICCADHHSSRKNAAQTCMEKKGEVEEEDKEEEEEEEEMGEGQSWTRRHFQPYQRWGTKSVQKMGHQLTSCDTDSIFGGHIWS